jgi:hypothetical protein
VVVAIFIGAWRLRELMQHLLAYGVFPGQLHPVLAFNLSNMTSVLYVLVFFSDKGYYRNHVRAMNLVKLIGSS